MDKTGGQPLRSTCLDGPTTRSRISGTHTWRRSWSRWASTPWRTGQGPTSLLRCLNSSRWPTSASLWSSVHGTTTPPGCRLRRSRLQSSSASRTWSSLQHPLPPVQVPAASTPSQTWSKLASWVLRKCLPCLRCLLRVLWTVSVAKT